MNVFLIKPLKVMEFFHIKECMSLLQVERQNIDEIKMPIIKFFLHIVFVPDGHPKLQDFQYASAAGDTQVKTS